MGIFGFLWHFKGEILLAAQFIAALRKTAQEVTREYIRRKLRERLKEQIAIIAFELALLAGAWWISATYHHIAARLIASLILWVITLYNLIELLFRTIPEIREVRRLLRGKAGYALKYVLQISVVTELMQLNILFLITCIVLGVSTRTYVASHFSYIKPWKEIVMKARPSSLRLHR